MPMRLTSCWDGRPRPRTGPPGASTGSPGASVVPLQVCFTITHLPNAPEGQDGGKYQRVTTLSVRRAREGTMDSRSQQEGAGAERRRHPRVQVTALGVPLAVRAILSGEQVTAHLVDVSLGGCCIAVPAAHAQTLV